MDRWGTCGGSPDHNDVPDLEIGGFHPPVFQVESRHPYGGVDVWGYARGKQIAVSPLSPMPGRTLLHEVAHVVLGHTVEAIEQDGPLTPGNIREVEAEGVALLCSAALGLEGAEYSRGYLQHWLRGGEILERSCQQIFKAADQILKAGSNQQTKQGMQS